MNGEKPWLRPEPYSAEEKQVIIRALKGLTIIGDAATWEARSFLLAWVGKATGRTNFAEIEQICRENSLPVNLLAVPAENIGGTNPVAIINPDDYSPRPYWVLPCGGPEDLEYYVNLYGVDDYDPNINLKRLELGGVSCYEGSEAARMAKAHLN